MQITPDTRPVIRRDLTITQGFLSERIRLLPGQIVKTGTPLTFEKNAWRAIKPGEVPVMFSASANMEEYIHAWRGMIVETHIPNGLQVGRVKILDVDDRGNVVFANDPEGPYCALTPSRVLLI